MADFEKLVSRAVSDEQFAQTLVDNPEQALRSAGIDPTPEMLDALRGVDVQSIQRLASAFGQNRAAI
ncbi:MAG: hypothetical protein KatS3mg057_3039 [Herpetosiphonaceae bacterium]|nr:MAG: hypothetical protein KatS3mg057_3039 [Herpetosiphonaceae bacterium]